MSLPRTKQAIWRWTRLILSKAWARKSSELNPAKNGLCQKWGHTFTLRRKLHHSWFWNQNVWRIAPFYNHTTSPSHHDQHEHNNDYRNFVMIMIIVIIIKKYKIVIRLERHRSLPSLQPFCPIIIKCTREVTITTISVFHKNIFFQKLNRAYPHMSLWGIYNTDPKAFSGQV